MDHISLIEKYLKKKIVDYKYITAGWDFDVYIVDNLIFRFPKTQEKKQGIIEEKQKLDVIREYVSLKIPEYEIVDNAYIVYPIISWESLPYSKDVYKNDVIDQLVWFMKELHSIPLSHFWYKEEAQENWDNSELKSFVESLKSDIDQKIGNVLSKDQMMLMRSYMDELFFRYESPKKSFVHTDLQGKNIIYDEWEKKVTWIIDFTDSRVWWIELDFCHFFDIGEEILRKFIEKYRGNRDQSFFERVFFLARRSVIFEINNDEIFNTKYDDILQKLKKYGFL